MRLADLPGTEVAVIVDMNAANEFTRYYVFQYEQPIFDISQARSIVFLLASDEMVKIRFDGQIVTLAVNANYRNSAETVYYGFGLSKKTGAFRLIPTAAPIYTLMEAISWNNRLAGDITCHSGGEGAMECSAESLSASCSVKCDTGYYACCDDTKNECRCKPKKEKKTKVMTISPIN